MPDEQKPEIEDVLEEPEKTPEQKCAEAEAMWKRALADYQNLQKEVARERGEMAQYAILRVVERFLPVFDNFNVAIEHLPTEALAKVGAPEAKTLQNWMTGVGFIQKQIADAMKDLGLATIKTVGEKFDASKHEAVGEEVVEGKEPGTIVKEVQAGYEIAGRVARPAKVITVK